MHAITPRLVIAGGDNPAPVAAATHRNRAMDEARVIAHLYSGEEAVGITVDNFAHGKRCFWIDTVFKHSVRQMAAGGDKF